MASKWVITSIYTIYDWGYNPLILTIDPNFQRDIQVGIFHETKLAHNLQALIHDMPGSRIHGRSWYIYLYTWKP